MLETTNPQIDSAEALLEDFERREGGKLDLTTLGGLRHTRMPDSGATSASSPVLPRADLPGGMIWPPVEGRLILHEATMKSPSLRQEANGDWCSVDVPGWWIQSPAHAQFNDLSAARSAMLDWARAHSAHAGILGGRRCIALSDGGDGNYRLWQCVSRSTTLLDQIEHALSRDVTAIVEALVESVRALMRARTQWKSNAIITRIDAIASTPHGPRYTRPMPYPCAVDDGCVKEDSLTFLLGEFSGVRDRLYALRHEIGAALALRAQPEPVAVLIKLLIRA